MKELILKSVFGECLLTDRDGSFITVLPFWDCNTSDGLYDASMALLDAIAGEDAEVDIRFSLKNLTVAAYINGITDPRCLGDLLTESQLDHLQDVRGGRVIRLIPTKDVENDEPITCEDMMCLVHIEGPGLYVATYSTGHRRVGLWYGAASSYKDAFSNALVDCDAVLLEDDVSFDLVVSASENVLSPINSSTLSAKAQSIVTNNEISLYGEAITADQVEVMRFLAYGITPQYAGKEAL